MAQAPKASDVDFRRTWDKDKYEKLAKDRLKDDLSDNDSDRSDGGKRKERRGPPVKRELLKGRDYKVDLNSMLGKTVVVTKESGMSATGGYYCKVCDCTLKDSINYLDHINGKKHQRNLGMSMKVERSSLDQVKARLDAHKRKREEEKEEFDFDARLEARRADEERRKVQRKDHRDTKKREAAAAAAEDDGVVDPDMAAIMGFGGFGSSKK